MKKFTHEQPEKSWRIRLVQTVTDRVILAAVDAFSGNTVSHLIGFDTGEVIVFTGAKESLDHEGYNPYEHNNKWDVDGKLMI